MGTPIETGRDSIASSGAPAIAGSPAAPDWATITREVKCPLCGYNLRGLINSRCPECGYQFEWPAVLDPDKDRHPYLFEHHPRRNIRSFVQTLFRSPLSSSNFWHTLDPAQRVRLGRLVLYWLIYATIALLPTLVGAGWAMWSILFQSTSTTINGLSRLQYGVRSAAPPEIASSGILLALFPWFNFLSLIVFQQSLRRSHVRAIHVLRCAVYCGDLVLWFSLAATVTLLTLDPQSGFGRLAHPAMALFLDGDRLLALLGMGLLAMMLLNGLRLWVAYRSYLRFPRPLSVIVASQIVVLLALLAALVCASEYMR